MRLDIT
jgi:hypothetical protein